MTKRDVKQKREKMLTAVAELCDLAGLNYRENSLEASTNRRLISKMKKAIQSIPEDMFKPDQEFGKLGDGGYTGPHPETVTVAVENGVEVYDSWRTSVNTPKKRGKTKGKTIPEHKRGKKRAMTRFKALGQTMPTTRLTEMDQSGLLMWAESADGLYVENGGKSHMGQSLYWASAIRDALLENNQTRQFLETISQ